MSTPPFTNLLDEDQPRGIPDPPFMMPSARACMSVAPAAFKLVHFLVSLITLVFILYIAQEARNNLAEATESLADVQELIPEVANSLHILKSICDAPQYKPYCG